MKKYIIGIVSFLMMMVVNTNVFAADKVKVYMITKDGCSWCQKELEVIAELQKEHPDLFDFVELEVFDPNWAFKSADAEKAFTAIYEHYGEDASRASTPTTAIGSYHVVGYIEKDEMYKQIVAQKGKKDEVKSLIANIDIAAMNADDTTTTTTDGETEVVTDNTNSYAQNPTETNNTDTYILLAIFVILIGGFAGLVYVGKKK